MNTVIYLHIAGFVIKITFTNINLSYFQSIFQKDILMFNEGFISKIKTKKVDFNLYFIGGQKVFLSNKKKDVSISFYKIMDNKTIVSYYHISRIQFILIIRYILTKLLGKNGIILHCSASVIQNKAYLFVGASGVGKSTISSLISNRHITLTDDIGIIRKIGNKLFFFQTPFFEKNDKIVRCSTKYNLGNLYFIHQSMRTHIKKLNSKIVLLKRIQNQAWTEKKEYSKDAHTFLLYFVTKHSRFFDLFFHKNNTELISNKIRSS